jgi:hypothetical protein
MATSASSKTDRQLQHDVIEELRFDSQVQVNEAGAIATDGAVTRTASGRLLPQEMARRGGCSPRSRCSRSRK